MKRLIAPLAITLVLVLALGIGALLRQRGSDAVTEARPAPTQTAQAPLTEAGPGPAALAHTANLPAPGAPAGGEPTAADQQAPQVAEAEAEQTIAQAEEPLAKTGCGKPFPCPGRSCEDCPNNRLLK